MSVVNLICGGTTPDGATFAAKVNGGGPVRVAVSTDPGMASPTFTASQAVDAQGVAQVSIAGLAPSTRHYWQVEDNAVLDTTKTGTFLTLPPAGQPASFTVATWGDAGLTPVFPGVAGGELDADRVSNAPTWDTLAQRALAENWLAGFNEGDWGYPDFGAGGLAESLANRRQFYDDNLNQPNQLALALALAQEYTPDDHDFAGNDSNGTYVDKANFATVFRERMPTGPLPDANAVYRDRLIGRVLFVVADVRYNRSPNTDPDGPSKTMLGAAQKSWMDALLASTPAEFLVWIMPQTWLGDSADSWLSFPTEQAEMIQMFGDRGFLGRMCTINADQHMVALDRGGNAPGGIPTLVAASIDATPLGNPEIYDLRGQAGRDQYGTLTITDGGSFITATLTGWKGTTQLVSHTIGVSTTTGGGAAVAQAKQFGVLLRGSNRVVFEARVLSDFQTGSDPDGEIVDVHGGAVRMSSIADVQRSADLLVRGRNLFPRRAGDLYLPDGQEVFLRRGIDAGDTIFWSDLGYFLIYEPDQGDAPHGTIRLECYDRMRRIIDSGLLAPREFSANDTYEAVFQSLVWDVYPGLPVLFDDDLATESIGRPLIVSRSRHEPLKTLAAGRGKTIFFDDAGLFRVESAVAATEPEVEIHAGSGGVLLAARRNLTRNDVINAIVVRSEGLDDIAPARAVAIDDGPQSLTRFGGRFGEVPDWITTPATSTNQQVADAARDNLLRRAGLPYRAVFTARVNPALRPGTPFWGMYRDGTRERHTCETLSIPMEADAAMVVATKEQRSTRIVVAPL